MTRGVKGPDGFVCRYYRQRKYTRHSESPTYRLEFVYTEGTPYINVNFKGHSIHDVINVWDYEKRAPLLTTRKEVHEAVKEYMKSLSRHDMEAHWENRPRS
jgi:hypothetical protein